MCSAVVEFVDVFGYLASIARDLVNDACYRCNVNMHFHLARA